jgi:hypothetical protein
MVVGRLVALTTTLVMFFVLGSWAGAWINPRRSLPLHPASVDRSEPDDDDATAGRPPAPPAAADPRQPEPMAAAVRAAAIGRDAAAIEAECRHAAGGNWDKWQRDTAPYRDSLKAKVSALKAAPLASYTPSPEGRYEALAPRDDFPLFEMGSREHLNYLYDPATLDEFRRDRAVAAASRWLRQRGIDLIFVPAPKMTEVYVEHFLAPCPADGIIAPHVRRTLLELLRDDVEVVDGFRLFRALRDTDAEYLYNTADTHWAPRGMRVMAKEIADRIARYQFGARARCGLPVVRATPGSYGAEDDGNRIGFMLAWNALTPEQQKRARPAQPVSQTEVKMPNGKKLPDDRASPVVVIGHSYAWCFGDQLVKELNLLINTRSTIHQTTEAFGDFLREPEALARCRVVVWVTTEQHLTKFKPMPKPIMKLLATTTSPPDTSPAPKPSSPR